MVGMSAKQIQNDVPENNDFTAYKQFRLSAIEESKDSVRHSVYSGQWVDDENIHPISRLRQIIHAYREHILYHAHTLIQLEPKNAHYICRALRIPQDKITPPDVLGKAAQISMFILPVPLYAMIVRAKRILNCGKTFQGRKYLFKNFIASTLALEGYNESIDFVLRFLEPSNSSGAYSQIIRVHKSWLCIAYKLGLTKWKDILHHFRAIPTYSDQGNFYLMLVNEGAITNITELKKAAKHIEVGFRPHYFTKDTDGAERVVRLLMGTGMSAELVSDIASSKSSFFNAIELQEIINLLELSGLLSSSNMNLIYETLGSFLWASSSKRWKFVLQTLKQESVTDLVKFKRIIETGGDLSFELASTLVEHGATTNELVLCQDILLSVGKLQNPQRAISAFKLLVSAPHNLSIEQISKCETYLCKSNSLNEFLTVLTKHQLGQAEGVLAFQRCYAVSYAEKIDKLIAIALGNTDNHPYEIISSWVCQAASTNAVDELEYLASSFDITEVDQLYQLLKYARMGKTLLKYLIEGKGVNEIGRMRQWYYDEAIDIKTVALGGELSATDVQLLDYAFDIKCFSCVVGNMKNISNEIYRRVGDIIGHYAPRDTEQAQNEYWVKRKQLEIKLHNEFSEVIPYLLEKTGGVILPSILKCAIDSPNEVVVMLDKLEPLVHELLLGKGPTSNIISELEKDAISLVYKTDTSTLETYWNLVVGKEAHIQSLNLAAKYPMKWQQTEHRLKRALDRKTLEDFSTAVNFALNFNLNSLNDMHIACKYLSPKRLLEPSADTHSLAHHLGLLLAVSGNTNVIIWSNKGFDELYLLEEDDLSAFNALSNIQNFFSVTLLDDIADKANNFADNLNEKQIMQLAEKIMDENVECSNGKEYILCSLKKTAEIISNIYGRWAKSELSKFVAEKSAENATHLVSVVSKYPSAFYAKNAVGMCTSGNTTMWSEDRHFHLVVFDENQKRMVGMAALYMEIIENVHECIPVLIMRAINPIDDMLARHEVGSIVQSFIDVAIKIAQDNNFIAVALTGDEGMHLLSNKQAIEDTLKNRYLKKAERFYGELNFEGISESWESGPKRIEDCFYGYEVGSKTKTDLYLLWKGKT